MSWHFSRALEAEFSGVNSSGGEPCAQSKSTTTPDVCSWPDKTTDALSPSQFGTTLRPSTGDPGAALLTWYLAGFHAKTSARPAKAKASLVSEADSGASLPESLARFDPDSRSWKTRQFSLLGGLEPFLETWPRWGMMRAGESYPLPMPSGLTAHRAWITSASASGLSQKMQTPTVQDARGRDRHNQKDGSVILSLLGQCRRMQTPVADDAVERKAGKFNSRGEPKLSAQVKRMPTVRAQSGSGGGSGLDGGSGARSMMTAEEVKELTGGNLNPAWVEWFMGWPIGWTALQPLEMDRWQAWRRSHGEPSLEK